MPTLNLETPEARYELEISKGCHFSFNCKCEGNNGYYNKPKLKKEEDFSETVDEYRPFHREKYKHTFIINQTLLLHKLEMDEEENKSPLIILCGNCDREFSFTKDSYFNLINKIMNEYNKNLK